MMVPTPIPPDYTAEILALRAAIASGATRVSYNGYSVDYDSLDGMKQRLILLTGWQMQLLNPAYRKPQAGFAAFRRGDRPAGFGYAVRSNGSGW
jgi:hypothetical protein